MTSREFADHVQRIVESVRGRILGIGLAQYDLGPEQGQRFETRPLDQIVVDALEEIDDLIVYAAQLRIRLEALQKTITGVAN